MNILINAFANIGLLCLILACSCFVVGLVLMIIGKMKPKTPLWQAFVFLVAIFLLGGGFFGVLIPEILKP